MSSLTFLELEDPRWLQFVASRPEATPFHHPAWARLLADCYGFEASALAVVADGTPIAGVPALKVRRLHRRRWVALPFTDALEPLGEPDAVQSLARGLSDLRVTGEVSSVELRCSLPAQGAAHEVVGVIHELSLTPDPDEVLTRFDKSRVRAEIRRADREGVTVRRGQAPGDLLEIFYGLHLATRRRQGVPVQPRRFFELLWERMLAAGIGHVRIAEVNGEAAAAAVLLSWNKRTIYKLAASNRELLQKRPNQALIWAAIRDACVAGDEVFDFGRSDLSNRGLRAFKSGWGAAEHELVYTSIGGTVAAPEGGRASRVLAELIQRSPPVVCRLLGETLYRYAA
jgi:CelD/BcsL family acetyltransferase involved in cellulose biosynthesis